MTLLNAFNKLVFAVVLLSIVAFCVAEANLALLIVAGSLAALAWYVTQNDARKALPRWVSTIGALVAVLWLALDLRWQQQDLLVAVGHFITWLQVLLLYTRKRNRDYVQLLLLSLMLMLAASVLNPSMIYSVLLAIYFALGIVTVLLLQLKAADDDVHRAQRAAAPAAAQFHRHPPAANATRRWQFHATAAVVGLICILVAAAVFVVTPRNDQPIRLDAARQSWLAKRTGFSNTVRLDGSAPRQGRQAPVLHLQIHSDDPADHSPHRAWLLRGAALDEYNHRARTWSRSRWVADHVRVVELQGGSRTLAKNTHLAPLEARIALRQSHHRTLFTLHQPPAWIDAPDLQELHVNIVDQQLSLPRSAGTLIYRLRGARDGQAAADPLTGATLPHSYARGWPRDADRVAQYAARVLAPLGLQRDPHAPHTPEDVRIAQALADHLRRTFTYSLDNPRVPRPHDPVLEFLFRGREGHCELFAASLAAMCRSIGIPARVITGYRASEYNAFGDYYVVREDNAHAWTEVYCGPSIGWRAFDATPPAAVAAEHATADSLLTTARQFYEHLEFRWKDSIAAFDRSTQSHLVARATDAVVNALQDEKQLVGQIAAFAQRVSSLWRGERLSHALAVIVMLLIAVMVAQTAQRLWTRRQRALALQVGDLPPARRKSLLRQLKFYLVMIELLEKQGQTRPTSQSPLQFATTLAQRDPQKFAPVIPLTQTYYHLRFGHRELTQDQQAQVQQHLKSLESTLAT